MKKRLLKLSLICFVLCFSMVNDAHANFKHLDDLIGPNDAVLLVTDSDECIYEKNADNALIPASTLKVLTALSAFHYLGDDFRFKTEFYLDEHFNLTIKGYGDPLLVSEYISNCCDKLAPIILNRTKKLNGIRFDDSFFNNVAIPGAKFNSAEPYDSPNGALCANFNTVTFMKDSRGHVISGEEQTPLLPFVVKRIQSTGLEKGRILLNNQESRFYAAYLFQYFLEKKGVSIEGNISPTVIVPPNKELIYTWESPCSLNDMILKLLEFSNNFIANQLFLTVGATVLGAPGTLGKGVEAQRRYALSELNLKGVVLAEGSGLSRLNRISARNMDRLLKQFQNHRFLMRKKGETYYKTGTLDGISTRVGYISDQNKKIYRFVVFCNTPGKSSEKITNILTEGLKNIE